MIELHKEIGTMRLLDLLRRYGRFAWAAAALAAAIWAPPAAFAAERIVLGEEFTATW